MRADTAQSKTTPGSPKRRGADETLVNARLRELFPGATAKAEAKNRGEREVTGTFKMLTHERIIVRPQVRRTFPKQDMDELRASIREMRAQGSGIEGTGLIQALLVTPVRDQSEAVTGYRLIAGEKRFRATRDEGISEVPCVIIPEVSEATTRLIQLTENLQRTPPPVLEEACAIRDTIDELNISLRDMGRMMGKSLGYVTERLGLLKMGEDVQQMVFARANTLRHARMIDPIKDEELRQELIAAALEGAGEREVHRRIEEANNPPEKTTPSGEAFAGANTHTIDSSADSKGKTEPELQSPDRQARPASPPDPLSAALRPGVAFIAEFRRQFGKLRMTREYREAVQREVALLEKELDHIKKKLDR